MKIIICVPNLISYNNVLTFPPQIVTLKPYIAPLLAAVKGRDAEAAQAYRQGCDAWQTLEQVGR